MFFQLQELNNRLENASQENKDLVIKVSSLEETVSSTDSERKTLQEKFDAVTEEKATNENEIASLIESLQALETEKQVCYLCISLRAVTDFLAFFWIILTASLAVHQHAWKTFIFN